MPDYGVSCGHDRVFLLFRPPPVIFLPHYALFFFVALTRKGDTYQRAAGVANQKPKGHCRRGPVSAAECPTGNGIQGNSWRKTPLCVCFCFRKLFSRGRG